MRRSARVLVACAWLLAAAPSVDVRAQGMIELADAPPGLEATPEELDAFWSVMSERLIHARELATKILRKNPKSFVAHYVMGEVEHDAEANFPRAVFHLEKARELFEQKYTGAPGPQAPWRWHTRIMLSLAFAYGEIERHDKKLTLLARYNELYDPDRIAERAWPLMKQRKFTEARRAAEAGLGTEDPRQKEIALNSLCAIEFEAGNDDASYVACKRAMDNAKSLGVDLDPADLMNFAEASRSVFKLDEAERIDREATEATIAWYGNPWSELAELYIREGRFSEALGALREIPKYRAARPPHVRESDRNENRRALSAFFLLLGRPDDALRITSKAVVAPDRRGHNSRDPAQDRSVSALLDRAAHRLKAERTLERAVSEPWYARIAATVSALYEQVQGWASGRHAVRAVADGDRLPGSFQIGTARAAVMPPWVAGDLVHAAGPGVSRSAIRRARTQDKRQAARAYYDAFEGEAAWLAGDSGSAEKLLARASQTLPQAEALLRARVLVALAKVREDRGATTQALGDFERAMQIDPSVLRRLSVTVPVRIRGASDGMGEVFADMVERSPRFDVGDFGLEVHVRGDRAGGEACLVGISGAQLACGRAEGRANESVEQIAKKLVADFHEKAFAARVDLSQADANSLDGSTLRGSEQDLNPLLEGTGME
jgi:tetratricopeptide (TPR) repeat protein